MPTKRINAEKRYSKLNATPINPRLKAHEVDTHEPEENTAGQKSAPAYTQPYKSQ